MILLLLSTVALGAILHRLTGMGFALVVSPMLVLILGAFDGVVVVNLCSAVSATLVFFRLRQHIEWAMVRNLVVFAVIGIIPGAWMAASLPGSWLQIAVGSLLIIALLTSLLVTRSRVVISGRSLSLVAGFVSGGMNAAAGLGGPALSAYAVLSRWNQVAFAATVQPFFLVIGIVSILAKIGFAPDQAPRLLWWEWASILLVLGVGHLLGDRLAASVSARKGRVGVVLISFVGALIAISNGIAQLR